ASPPLTHPTQLVWNGQLVCNVHLVWNGHLARFQHPPIPDSRLPTPDSRLPTPPHLPWSDPLG
ncbi:hypothetical protein, partial [Moorena sp. SIO2C4]|uniref:hypothetical protein n=1 Tax=Moorena sp. SIO2C4 TaxID=2607824 RepID=UPI00257EF892